MHLADPMNRVVVVDDDPISLEFVNLHLRDADYSVQAAQNGAEALPLIEQGARIVISDWVMPNMNGLQLCRAIRSRPGRPYVYFIMVTSNSDRASLLQAFGAGVDDFLGKPLNEAELLAWLHAGVRTIRLQDELERRAQALESVNEKLSRANERLRLIATTDELTELPNRRSALLRLQEEWTQAEQRGLPLSCAMIDLDRFKEINDVHGHGVGDVVLRQVIDAMRRELTPDDVIYRIGGDELLILFPNLPPESAFAPMERCRLSVASEALCAPRHNLHASISVGIGTRTKDMFRPHNLLHAADKALLAAKRAGGNQVQVIAAGQLAGTGKQG